MTNPGPQDGKTAQYDQLLEDCGGGFFESLWRIGGTIVGVVILGSLLYALLAVEIRAMAYLDPVRAGSPLLKGLILVALLLVGLLLIFWIIQKTYEFLQTRRKNPSDPVFDRIARLLDNWFRNLDWCTNRSRWCIRTWQRFFILPGHSYKPTVFAVLMAAILALGPRLPMIGDGIVSYSLVFVAFILILFANRWWPKRLQYLPHLLVLVFLSLAVFFWPKAAIQRVVDAEPYRHFFIPAFWIIALATPLAASLSFLLFAKYKGRVTGVTGQKESIPHEGGDQEKDQEVGSSAAYRPSAMGGQHADCQSNPTRPLDLPTHHYALGIDVKRFARSLIKAPFYHPLQILYWPSIPVLLIADPDSMGHFAFFLGVAAWVVYALGEMHEELDNFLRILQRALFRGGQLLVSIAVVGLAAGRLLDNSYVRTLVEGEGLLGWMNNWVLLHYLASAYVLFWYFEYWTNCFVSERLLAMFESSTEVHPPPRWIRIRYLEDEKEKDGVLVVHEASRYALIGERGSPQCDSCVKRMLGRVKLLQESITDRCKIDVSGRWLPSGSAYLAGREFKLVLVHRLRFYFVVIYAGLATLGGYGTYKLHLLPQRAELVAQVPDSNNQRLFNLREHLFSRGKRQQRPAILLAASGGGTRAAVYTYSVLNGLHDLGVLQDVVLASGVSGGSAAIAYFAMHRDKLLSAATGKKGASRGAAECKAEGEECKGWDRFGAVMSAPFIQDALKGLTELRMAWGCPADQGDLRARMRLGVQLQESFDRWFPLEGRGGSVFLDGCLNPLKWSGPGSPVTRLGDQSMVGLVFNTALAGSFDRERFDCSGFADCAVLPLAEVERLASENDRGYKTSAAGKGGRLILTNLKISRNAYDGSQGPFPDETDVLRAAPGDYLTYMVINDPGIPLVSAAALSANFPPVFPNAAVDVDDHSRYWVTDGGATDNRGVVSLLYALEGAMREERRCQQHGESGRRAEDVDGADAELLHQGHDTCERLAERNYPPIHIVLAEASATDPVYQQDRGITTTFGAAERFASQLIVDKVKKLARFYDEELEGQGIYLHKLAMPLTLRSAGGIGTHWMLPQHVTLRAPAGLPNQCGEGLKNSNICWPESEDPVERFLRLTMPGVDMPGAQAKRLVEALHWTPSSREAFPDVCTPNSDQTDSYQCQDVRNLWQSWICKEPGDNPHRKSWYCFVKGIEKETKSDADKTYTVNGCESRSIPSCEHTRITWKEID